jgi:hypothetical protein
MRKLYIAVLSVLLALPFAGRGQIIAWNLNSNTTSVATVAATTTDINLAAGSVLSRGAGVTATTLSGAFAGSNWVATTQAGAETNNTYFQFTITGATGTQVSLSTLDAWFRRSGTGPNSFQWEYSLDGFATAGVAIGSIISYTLTTTGGDQQSELILSGISALQNVAGGTTITIRLYGWGASGSSGTFALGRPTGQNSLSIGGTVTPPVTPNPAITVTPSSLSGFTTTPNNPSISQSVMVNGSNLTDNITITAPSGYEVSSDNSSFGPSVTLTQSGGSVAATAIYVRIASSATLGAVTGNLSLTSTGATAQSVTLSGSVNPPAANVVINQIYGGGGNSDATYTNDFIELYNNENTPVDLTGWSVQYTNATGSGWSSNLTPLSGTIPAHGFFLVQESRGTGGTTPLPIPDVSGSIAMSGTQGKVILCNTTVGQTGDNPTGANIIDMVGYGGADVWQGSGPAPLLSNTTADVRKVDGANSHDNAADFKTIFPLPRNSSYTVTGPVAILYPVNGFVGLSGNYAPNLVFNKPVAKGTGNVTLFTNGVAGTPIDINDPGIVLTNDTLTINIALSAGNNYAIEIDPIAIVDAYGNNYAGLTTTSSWVFSTYNPSVAMVLADSAIDVPVRYDFNFCTGTGLLPYGFIQYSVTGTQKWDCTAFGRDPNAPQGTAAFPSGVQMNGYSGGTNFTNQDWLISPRLDLTGTSYPLLAFWSRNAFAGDPLQLKISTDYSGTGDPTLATWTDLNGRFPSVGSDTWTQSSNINLSAFRQSGIYVAFVYTSTTDGGSRWTLDDISLVNSSTPPPPSLTLSTANLEFGYAQPPATVDKKLIVTGNDIVADVTVTSEGSFLLSTDSVHFGTTITLGHDTANNVPEPVYVRFAPAMGNNYFVDSLHVVISDSTARINVKGNSIDPSTTLSIVNWNLNWFGTPDPTLGVSDKSLQETNVATILPTLHADLYALEEVVNQHALDSIVGTMPGYAYVINDYGSYSSTALANPDPLNTVQKLAFVYNTAKISVLRTDPLLTTGINTAADTATKYYNDWASGRFPYMLTANVTLNDPNGGSPIVRQVRFINIHAKANTSPVLTAYQRRQDGAHALDSLLKSAYPTDNVMILGDFNDDLNQTITAGIAPPTTSYSSFTIDDASLYKFPTQPLSLSGQHSDVNYTSVIDNVIVNNVMASWYLPSSATVLSDVGSLVTSYGTTTTDHYPVFSQFSFSPPASLPVTLLNFTATRQEEAVKLSWTTAQEANSKEFDVERSADGVHFTAIGIVAGRGNSTVPSAYSFYDQQPLTGSNYYRLKQVDLDGHGVYSRTVKLDFSSAVNLKILPNPAHGSVNILVGNTTEALSLRITDMSGRVVKQIITAPGTSNVLVDLTGMARGIYSVKAISSTSMATQKLQVQ